jgi:hypothetical protein
VANATHALQRAGMTVTALRTTATFAQLDVRLDTESIVVDLVPIRRRSPMLPSRSQWEMPRSSSKRRTSSSSTSSVLS